MAGYVGIDYGSARTGVATAPPDVRLASPYGTWAPQELPEVLHTLQPEVIVVGLPRSLDGGDTLQTLAVRRFAADVTKGLTAELVFQDEAGTSSVAEERLQEAGKPFSRADIDAEAAAIILQDYLDSL